MAARTVGKVTVASGGTPVQCTTSHLPAQSIKITPLPGNAGVLYYGLAGMVTSTGVNVLGVIPKPASATTGPFEPGEIIQRDAPNGLNVKDIWLDGTSNDGAIVSFVTG